jgi:hypothetical protein
VTDAARPRLSCRPIPTRRRAVTGLALSAAAALVLTGCGEVKLGSAAVVGNQRITDERVQSLVEESLAAPGVREALPTSDYKGDLGAYRRAVLNVEVERLLVETAVRRLGIPVDEGKVDSRYRFFEQQSGGAGRFASQLAARLAVSPALYRQLVRTEVLESEIGYEQGGVKRPTEDQLRALYRQALPSAITATLSLIQVPDEATATRVLAELKAAPASFAQVAGRYAGAGSQTAAQPKKYPLSQLPVDLAARVQRAERNETFSYRLSDGNAQAFFVIRSGGVERPSLDSLRPQLEARTLQQAAAAGQKYLSQVAREVGVDVNPRYGTWKVDQLVITDFVNPVIKPTPSPPAPTGTVPGAPADPGSGGAPADPGASPTPGN